MSSKSTFQHLRLPLVALCAVTAAACAGSTPEPELTERAAAGNVEAGVDTAAIRDSVAREKAGARSVATPTGVQLSAPPASQAAEAARAAQANPPAPATRMPRDSAAIADSIAKEKAAARSVATPTGVQLSAPPASQAIEQAAPAQGAGQSMHGAHGAMPSPEGVTFTDPNVAATASASNQSEIQPSQLALQKSQHEGVRAYAQRMIDDHGRFETQMQALLQQKSIAPEHNAFSQQLQQMLPPTLQALQAADGAAFDRLFMEHMVMSHQATLNALDKALIPSATDPQLKSMLQDQVRPAVAQHLEQAQQLQQQVGRTP